MNNLYFKREENSGKPFTPEEVKSLLSSDFEVLDMRFTPNGEVSDLVVTSTKHPELTGLDPITKGICLSLTDDLGYWSDPRFFKAHDVYLDEVIPDLMTDLELEFDYEKML